MLKTKSTVVYKGQEHFANTPKLFFAHLTTSIQKKRHTVGSLLKRRDAICALETKTERPEQAAQTAEIEFGRNT